MRPLTEVLEKVVEEVSKAAGLKASVGWKPDITHPAITLQMRSCEITPLDITSSKHLLDISIQIDVWHTSPLARDKTADSLIQHFEEERSRLAEELGLCGFGFEAAADMDEEHGFRKMLLLRLKTVG
ncbi:MAG: hypothetical protein NZ570_08015 [Candidatus Caldarchaeum sp.]|nr:hypothetical protein [Candidatus Caldarchaeum sp.]MCS7137222.1 hypothetical protein [Candidatus Caldarchaeum sp.]MDW7977342.1 hypothetical protein [Candidatus Caldarchaeum sp.]MDW8359673.1 hypothetical protein [Candidatus Caldarchaeum sp.]